ncbi:MAG: efflux RND transporter periplasmic adaptor subunit [Nitrospiraceae bacterium]|nr:efflux RND transporter periplasmic adaptor subunit [Nitrospiraceae bacterium]
MKFPLRGILVGVVTVCLAAGGYLVFRDGTPKAKKGPATDAGPVASVRVAPLKMASLSAVITAYGDVIPAPGAVQVVSMPYETRVSRVMVSSGQKISKGDALLEIEPSPDTLLKLEQAKNSYEISKQNLDHVKQLFSLKLATNAQILKAQEVFRRASLQLESLRNRGVDGKRVVRASASGLISSVQIQEGAIVPAGNPLAGIIAQNRLEVRLGVEPGDTRRLASGRPVSLSYVNEPGKEKVEGGIRKVSRAINPATRLVDVFVTLPKSAGFLLGEYIMGRIETASSYGMTAPRSAVLPEGGGHVLYTVVNGRAVKHIVQTGLESGNQVQVSGGGLKPGDEAVVLGNYELEDGMAVKAENVR